MTTPQTPLSGGVAIVLHPDNGSQHGPIEIVKFDRSNSLVFLQEVVGGLVEVHSLYTRWTYGGSTSGELLADAWMNEEGKIQRLPGNGRAREVLEVHGGLSPFDIPCGPVVLTSTNSEGDTVSLTLAAADTLLSKYFGVALDSEALHRALT